MELTEEKINSFKTIIWDYYKTFGRSFEWRDATNPYHIVVSEIMLQQTQTFRVSQKYCSFITQFSSFDALAIAATKDVITAWSGLGYNRRALYLQQIARTIIQDYNGILPNKPEILINFPGIGKATAASICAFAFNMPTVFIETNIRTVFIHFFFENRMDITDDEILPLIAQTVDQENTRQWYYALMDYGVMLKQHLPNPSRKSAHYSVQSKFEGSDRQIRGTVLKLLMKYQALQKNRLIELINKKEERVEKIVAQLCAEGFIINFDDQYKLKE